VKKHAKSPYFGSILRVFLMVIFLLGALCQALVQYDETQLAPKTENLPIARR
jgi:hypothetical protein